jgi:hypothetical protein
LAKANMGKSQYGQKPTGGAHGPAGDGGVGPGGGRSVVGGGAGPGGAHRPAGDGIRLGALAVTPAARGRLLF